MDEVPSKIRRDFFDRRVTIIYTNHRGEESQRNIVPLTLRFGTMAGYYTEPVWLLEAFDLDKDDYRTFAMSKIKEFTDKEDE